MPSTRIAFRPEAEALAAVGRAHVEAAQLAHAVEPVANGVAVGEELLGGVRHVAVGGEERLEGADQLGLVLAVVVHQRRDGLLVEALQLGGVLAHRGQQQPVGAGLVEREAAWRRAPRPRWPPAAPRRRAVQVDRVRRRGGSWPPPAAKPLEADLHLLEHGLGRPLGRLAAVAGHEDHQLAVGLGRAAARRPRRAAAAAAGPARSPRPATVRSTPRAPRSATASTRARQSPSSALLRAGAGHDHAAPSPRSQPSSSARAVMFSRSVTLRAEQVGEEVADRRLAGALGRPRAVDLLADQRRDDPQQRGRRRRAARAQRAAGRRARRPRAAPATSVSPSPASTARSSSGDWQATASTRNRAPSTTTLASRACAAARATAGSPAPDSTASETSSNASRKGLWAARSWRFLGRGQDRNCRPEPRTALARAQTQRARRTCRRTRRPAGRARRRPPRSVPRMNSVRKPAATRSHSRP